MSQGGVIVAPERDRIFTGRKEQRQGGVALVRTGVRGDVLEVTETVGVYPERNLILLVGVPVRTVVVHASPKAECRHQIAVVRRQGELDMRIRLKTDVAPNRGVGPAERDSCWSSEVDRVRPCPGPDRTRPGFDHRALSIGEIHEESVTNPRTVLPGTRRKVAPTTAANEGSAIPNDMASIKPDKNFPYILIMFHSCRKG